MEVRDRLGGSRVHRIHVHPGGAVTTVGARFGENDPPDRCVGRGLILHVQVLEIGLRLQLTEHGVVVHPALELALNLMLDRKPRHAQDEQEEGVHAHADQDRGHLDVQPSPQPARGLGDSADPARAGRHGSRTLHSPPPELERPASIGGVGLRREWVVICSRTAARIPTVLISPRPSQPLDKGEPSPS